MELSISLKFIYLEHRKAMYLADYTSGISRVCCTDLSSPDNYGEALHIQKVLSEEFESAITRANKRLLADGCGEEGFCKSPTENEGPEVGK